MNSSIFNSDAPASRFLRHFAGMAVVACMLVLAFLVVVDPYDTGRLTLLTRPGVPETAPRLASASRLRDPASNAAIMGNSTIQLVSPERLKPTTGLDFVQLSVPGTGPLEQALMVERLFTLRGNGIRALVLGLDGTWCDANRETNPVNPFPFWLHGPSDGAYMLSLFRMSSLEFLPGRILVMLGSKRAGRRDGYWDFEPLKPPPPPDHPRLPPMMAPAISTAGAAIGSLQRIVAAMPAETRLVLVHPPIHVSALNPVSEAERRMINACKAALQGVVAGRPRTAIADFWVDDGSTRTPELFFDATHYRRPLAERIEAAVSNALPRRE